MFRAKHDFQLFDEKLRNVEDLIDLYPGDPCDILLRRRAFAVSLHLRVFSICCALANCDICGPGGSPLRERDAEFSRKSLTMMTEEGLVRERHGREPSQDEIEEQTGRAHELQRELAMDGLQSVPARCASSGTPKTSLSSDAFLNTFDLR
jgi:hypothetical protein